jgi:hypothetical protein
VLGAFAPVLNAIVEDMSELFGVVEDGETDVNKLKTEFKELGETIATNLVNGIANSVEGFGDMIMAVQRFGLETQIAVFEVQRLLNATNPLEFAKFTIQIERAKVQLEKVQNPLIETANKIRDYGEGIGTVIQSQISLNNSTNKTNDELEDQADKLLNIQNPLEVYSETLDDLTKFTDQNTVKAFKNAEDALVDFVRTGEADFKKFTDNVIRDLIRLQIRMTLITPFFTAFEAAGGFGKGGLFAGFGALFGGGKADGGSVKGGTPYLVGERGAELFVPNASGQIITNENTKAMMGSAEPVSVNFTIQATDASGFDELLVSRKNQIVAMISQAMNQKGKVGLI